MENLNKKTLKSYKGTFYLKQLLKVFEEDTGWKVGYIDETILCDDPRKINIEDITTLSWKEFLNYIGKAFDCKFVFSEIDKIMHVHKIIKPKLYLKEYYIKGIYGDVYFCKETIEEKIIEDAYNCNTPPHTKFDVYIKDIGTNDIVDSKENVEGLPYRITEDIYYKMAMIQNLKQLNKTIVLANGGTFEGTFIKKEEDKDIKEIVKEVINETLVEGLSETISNITNNNILPDLKLR
jgi:hypothetical protein